ncbi:unnamed protein product [Clonostachys rosea f. rosea IK726]|uniref:Uncharacterized protein n=1 Tax=Clonostachys rosea f. rosea IK726 TaxID=1349383 RepID=A0ACA9TPE8_BIOOC|nr:unnamed protein product [Clonostachys rosea f. rosea IK726]
MRFFEYIAIFLTAITGGMALEESAFKDAPKWEPAYTLKSDEVIVGFGNNSYVVKADEYLAILKDAGVTIGTPKLDSSWVSTSPSNVQTRRGTKRGLDKRCSSTEYIITDKTETFIDWDVQMSPVLCAAAGDMDITVTDGYSISNAVTTSVGIDQTLIEDILKVSFRVDYTETWTTTASTLTKGTVKDGNCGVMITKPITTRRSGRFFRGCIGSATQVGTWYADSHGNGSYNGVDWIQGAISMCTKQQDNPPLTRCTGQGDFA